MFEEAVVVELKPPQGPLETARALAEQWLVMWGASERGEPIPDYDDGTQPGTSRPIDDPKSNVFKIAQVKACLDSYRTGLVDGLAVVELARWTWVEGKKVSAFKSQYREVETVFLSFGMSRGVRNAFLRDRRKDIRERLASMILDTFASLPPQDRTGVAKSALKPTEAVRPYAAATPKDYQSVRR